MNRIFRLIVFLLLGALASCDNPVKKQPLQVDGYWIVESAFRDKRATQLLADVFFQFEKNGQMMTNLPNTAEGFTEYEIKGDQIIQKADSPITYSILNSADSTLVLSIELNNTPFEIHLKRSAPPVFSDPEGGVQDSVQ